MTSDSPRRLRLEGKNRSGTGARLDTVDRISRDDEERLTDSIRRTERNELRAAVDDAFAELDVRLNFIAANLPHLAPGTDQTSRIKAARRVIAALRSGL